MIKINHEAITSELERILQSVGGRPVDFRLPPPPTPSDVTLSENDLPSLVALIHEESGLLNRNGRPVFVYIPDHKAASKFGELRSVHFMACETLRGKEKEGKLGARFRVTERDDNLYRIDVGRESLEKWLPPCQNCLLESGYPGFPTARVPRFDAKTEPQRMEVVHNFDAKKAFSFMRECFETFRSTADGLRPAEIPTGYPSDWRNISRKFRQARNFTCESPNAPLKRKGCGVNLSMYPDIPLTDTHHIDGDETNIQEDNLVCLCKLCHADKHKDTHHYWVSPYYRLFIEATRKEQGIS